MNQLVFPTFRLDLDSELVLIAGEAVRLRPKTWSVLRFLAENPGRVVTKDELLDQVWAEVAVSDDMPRLCIGEIRKVIGDNSKGSAIIETVHGKGYRMLLRPRSAGGPPRTRLAVFQFIDHTPDQELANVEQVAEPEASKRDDSAELAPLLTRGLNGLLATYDDFDVAGSRSTHAAQKRYSDLTQQANALGVATVLHGSCRNDANGPGQLEVVAELLDVGTSKTLWQRAFLRDLNELSELQAHIADEVAEALRSEGQPSSSMIKLQRSSDSSVYHLYLRGLRLQDRFESSAWEAAEGYYRRATELDAQYAPAWAGLAAIALLRANSGDKKLSDQFELANQYAVKALTLDPDLPDAHSHLGTVETLHRWNFDEAERRYRTALALRPSFARVYFAYQTLLSILGRHDEARAAGQRGFELEPLSTTMVAYRGFADLNARAPESALACFEEALEGDPDNTLAHLGSAIAHRDLGDLARAVAELEQCQTRMEGLMVPSLIAHTLALMGDSAGAQSALDDMTQAAGVSDSVPLTYRAVVQGALGNTDAAFELLDEAVEQRESNVVNLIDRTFDPIRDDPRFADVVTRIGLPKIVASATTG